MSYFSRFIEWQNYVHYLLLAMFLLWVLHPISTSIGLEQWFMQKNVFMKDNWFALIKSFYNIFIAWVTMFLYYAFGFLIGDSIIHGIFYFLPKPYQWRD